jgi:hypothetical protein
MKRARLRAMAGKKEGRCSSHMLISRTVQSIERSVINADHKVAVEIPSCCMQQSVPLLQRHQVCARPVVVCKQQATQGSYCAEGSVQFDREAVYFCSGSAGSGGGCIDGSAAANAAAAAVRNKLALGVGSVCSVGASNSLLNNLSGVDGNHGNQHLLYIHMYGCHDVHLFRVFTW